ncbi:hypothetical protein AKJ39_01275 [candidate division MSBL1 archaeon SCGC-AAA259J03]|uniref:Polymerase nucleotidyl transferase domain-containing protein n=1 Tax=candidate division MSBL1 archaeon SCGC-AAA259J03 TaxID=1698269 RepID=A0A656YX59_9EURY|nr:hypothetical protein AKJ39_01275 [candidate division MSBL1 archaeon SCGC-AAA259J03]
MESCPGPVMVLVTGSTVHGEMTELSDVDGTVFLNFSRRAELDEYRGKFRGLAEEQFGKSTEKKFYEPHWSVFFYSCEAIRDTDVFARFNGELPADFTMFNLKENSLLLYGEERRDEFPVEYRQDMIDEWASFAPSYHLKRAEKLAGGKDRIRACYALSRSILQTTRVMVWKEAKCTSSSYSKIVGAYRELGRCESLPIWALEAREQDFDVPLKKVRDKLKPSNTFIWSVLREELYERS